MPDATIYDRCAIIRANAPNFKDEMATVIILEVLDRIDELRPRGWPHRPDSPWSAGTSLATHQLHPDG